MKAIPWVSVRCIGLLAVLGSAAASRGADLDGMWYAEIGSGGNKVALDLQHAGDAVSGSFLISGDAGQYLGVPFSTVEYEAEDDEIEFIAVVPQMQFIVQAELELEDGALGGGLTTIGFDGKASSPMAIKFVRDMPEAEALFSEANVVSIEDAMSDARTAARRASSQNNLKQLGLVLKMYANESKGERYPPMSSEPGNLMFEAEKVYPEYLIDAAVLVSPMHPEAEALIAKAQDDPLGAINDNSYWYLGHAVMDEDAGLAMLDYYEKNAGDAEALAQDIPVDIEPLNTIYMIREGIERFFITDINSPGMASQKQSQLPVMIERIDHFEGGTNVLFLDGHVEFMEYPGEFPMTEKFIRKLQEISK